MFLTSVVLLSWENQTLVFSAPFSQPYPSGWQTTVGVLTLDLCWRTKFPRPDSDLPSCLTRETMENLFSSATGKFTNSLLEGPIATARPRATAPFVYSFFAFRLSSFPEMKRYWRPQRMKNFRVCPFAFTKHHTTHIIAEQAQLNFRVTHLREVYKNRSRPRTVDINNKRRRQLFQSTFYTILRVDSEENG